MDNVGAFSLIRQPEQDHQNVSYSWSNFKPNIYSSTTPEYIIRCACLTIHIYIYSYTFKTILFYNQRNQCTPESANNVFLYTICTKSLLRTRSNKHNDLSRTAPHFTIPRMQHAPTYINRHDEEAPSHYLDETSSHKNDEHFIDGACVEDWILKTQEQAERNRDANVSASSQNVGRTYGGKGGT
jgi:hypothetical protein